MDLKQAHIKIDLIQTSSVDGIHADMLHRFIDALAELAYTGELGSGDYPITWRDAYTEMVLEEANHNPDWTEGYVHCNE
jgi:hypothetical protein